MRVIAGTYRSRKLKGPGKLSLRPTSDRLRETLFNILGPSIEDSLLWTSTPARARLGLKP
jgi:16S rRNA (guanine966-N2)-methyltransferase